jgi:hypothetical protein
VPQIYFVATPGAGAPAATPPRTVFVGTFGAGHYPYGLQLGVATGGFAAAITHLEVTIKGTANVTGKKPRTVGYVAISPCVATTKLRFAGATAFSSGAPISYSTTARCKK